MTELHADVAVIGAGIVGLAHALAAARRGLKVVVVERNDFAVGASVRNFGLVWPVGQPLGLRLNRALRTKEIWLDVCSSANLYLAQSGSLHLAHRADERAVIEEYAEQLHAAGHTVQVISPAQAMERSPCTKPDELIAALWSPMECMVDPREAIRTIPHWLSATLDVQFRFGTTAHEVGDGYVQTSTERWRVQKTIVCSGADFEHLFPEVFSESGLVRVKLQMMRTHAQPDSWRMGPALCAGLTLLHYDSFEGCPSRSALLERVLHEMPEYVSNGIHVLVSQTRTGEITIGDSHVYGHTHEPFDDSNINRLILQEFKRFVNLPHTSIAETWHGIYPKLDGRTEFIHTVSDQVVIVNGLGGAGMTLSFGLAEEVLQWLW